MFTLIVLLVLGVLFWIIAAASRCRNSDNNSEVSHPGVFGDDLLWSHERTVFDLSPRHGFLGRLCMEDAERRGEDGEGRLFRILKEDLPLGGADGYRIIRNLMMEDGAGGTTQVDFVVVSAFGVFVVEAKAYSGWVFGSQDQAQWTVSLPGGRKFQFQNPIRQNYKHVCVLADKTGIPRNLVVPVVAFGREADFKTNMPPGVVHFEDVAAYIQGFRRNVIKLSQLGEIVQALLDWDRVVGEDKRRNHVGNLKAAHAPASVNDLEVSCPICGGRMVLRHRKADGKLFFGCSRFPACKGIRQAVG